ncbi:MAG: hypothetical protein ACI9OH_000643 [Oleispira sp.]|jgi:uncharacterized protein (UPF0276 family)
MKTIDDFKSENTVAIGVGLRHPHYSDVLAPSVGNKDNDAKASPIDFVEVHSENFFAQGGASRALIREVAEKYPVSLHSTALGLGSKTAIAGSYLESLNELVKVVNPFLMSDHAAFSWSELDGRSIHAGDLLPIAFNQKNLKNMADNIDAVQQLTGRRLLIENLSAYLTPRNSVLAETEFLITLAELTQCGLLIDLNNLVVNANNFSNEKNIDYAKQWLQQIPRGIVGEIHLAGFTPVGESELAIDDHSQPVSDVGWQLYQFALQRFGAVPTLIEWDNNLPTWQALLNEANKARMIANEVIIHA